ncbi:MAG: hypothetical protein M3Z98_01510 [Candidatus Dormibacteraeota bacterium]|nr:hypothetical protein [Candidatus Dormibacteraeota bacterium]
MSDAAGTQERRRRFPAAPLVAVNFRTFVTLLALLATVSLLGTTLATLNATTVNPGATFTAGALILSNQVNNRHPCLSSAAVVSCDGLFKQELTPGTTYQAVVTIRNQGTVPAETLQLWANGPCTSGTANPTFSGTGDLCSATWISIHDDAHDFCYFPVRAAGSCPLGIGGTIVDLAKQDGPNNPISLAVDQLAAGIPYTFAIELDPSVGNEFQGRKADFSITWKVAQG